MSKWGIKMRRYAVFISCEEYKEFDDIDFCHSDSVLMENTLVDYCDYDRKDIQLLLIYIDAFENDVSYLYKTISEIINKMEKEDTFLFYFAGHGMLYREDEYLILPDTVQNDIEGTALSLKYLNSILKRQKEIHLEFLMHVIQARMFVAFEKMDS